MQVKELMSETVICVTPGTSLQDTARLMKERDIGALPVVASEDNRQLIGMITDRDITCRTLADGRNPMELMVEDAMSGGPIFSVHAETDERDLCQLMETHQVRRMPVVDERGNCCGIVSQADLARNAPEHDTAEVLQRISQPIAR